MALYLIKSVDEIPIDTEYRILGESLEYWEGRHLIETKEDIPLEKAPEKFPNGIPTDSKNCLAKWVRCGQESDPIQDKINILTDELVALQVDYPEKVDAAVAIKLIPKSPVKPIEEIGEIG